MKKYHIQRGKVIVVPVKLTGPKGEKWTQAILDTGATYSMFPPTVLKALGCPPSAVSDSVKIITASSIEYVPILRIPSIEIFGKALENIQIVSHLLPPSTPAQGLIGINMLEHFNIELNFSQSTMIIDER